MKETESIEYQWPYIESFLPELEASAAECGALVRRREVKTASDLLRLAMVYGFCGLSLRETAAWGAAAGVAEVSDVALLKRFRNAGAWLGHLLAQKIVERAKLDCRVESEFRVRLVDASSISVPGSKGTDWRAHVSFDLARLAIDQLHVTDAKVGESLTNFSFDASDLIVADRGYAHRNGLATVDAAGASFLVRLPLNNVPLETPDSEPFDLIGFLRKIPDAAPAEANVRFRYRNRAIPCRFLALRKSEAAAQESRRKTMAERRKKGRNVEPVTLEAAGYTFLLSNVPAPLLPLEQAFELYRLRWQVELTFKRLKSLVHLDEINAKEPRLAQTFLFAKLLGALVIEDLTSNYLSISPWGYILRHQNLALAASQDLR